MDKKVITFTDGKGNYWDATDKDVGIGEYCNIVEKDIALELLPQRLEEHNVRDGMWCNPQNIANHSWDSYYQFSGMMSFVR